MDPTDRAIKGFYCRFKIVCKIVEIWTRADDQGILVYFII